MYRNYFFKYLRKFGILIYDIFLKIGKYVSEVGKNVNFKKLRYELCKDIIELYMLFLLLINKKYKENFVIVLFIVFDDIKWFNKLILVIKDNKYKEIFY